MRPDENYDPNAAQPQQQPQPSVTPEPTPYPVADQSQPIPPSYAAEPVVEAPAPVAPAAPAANEYAQAPVQPITPVQPEADAPVNPFAQQAPATLAANPFGAPSEPVATPATAQQPIGSAPVGIAPVGSTPAPSGGSPKKFPTKLVVIIGSVIVALLAVVLLGLPLLNKVAPNIVPDAIVSNGIIPATGVPLQEYESPAGKFTMKIPEGWVAKEDKISTTTFIGFSKPEESLEDTTVEKTAALIVICSDTSATPDGKKYTKEEYLNLAKSGERGETVTVKSEGEVKINGLDGYKIVASNAVTKDGVTTNKYSAAVTIYIDESRGCAISFAGPEEDKELSSSIDAIFNSFKLN